jgi:hypothetical protein
LPETAAAQLDEFRVIQADVEQRRPQLEAFIGQMAEQLAQVEGQPKNDWAGAQHEKLKADWATVQVNSALLE